MDLTDISITTEWNLCCGCGVCVGICPKHCIGWERKEGMYLPVIDRNGCVACGLCAGVCSGLNHSYEKLPEQTAVQGKVLMSCNAWSRSEQVRYMAASGGVVSTLVRQLLEKETYDIAFLVDGYDYRQQLVTKPVAAQNMKNAESSRYPKSRYLPVSHENAITYVKRNRAEKVIFVGTPCAVRGFKSAIEKLHLPRENYLLIGLFCDRVFNYNVIEYYQQPAFCGSKKLENLHFKNKESGGWPGNMKFFFADGSTEYQDKSEREKVKDYFMPERCLYCIDKLNVCADISLGDNYTGQDSSPLGSNSVIIRTKRGIAAWKSADSLMESRKISVKQIMEAQDIDWRLNNLCYGKLKEQEILKKTGQTIVLNSNVMTEREEREYLSRWKSSMQMLYAGERYSSHPEDLQKQMIKDKKRQNTGKIRKIFLKMYYLIRYRTVKENCHEKSNVGFWNKTGGN